MGRLKPYISYLLAVRGTIAAALFYAILFGVSSGFGVPVLLDKVFPVLFDKGTDLPPALAAQYALPTSTIILIASAIPLAFLLRAWSSYRNGYFTQIAGVKILEAIRLDYFRKLQVLPLSFLQNKSSGDLISRGLADTAQLQATLTTIANDGVKQPFVLAGAVGFLIWKAYTNSGVLMVLACIVTIPLCVFPVRYVGRMVLKRAMQLQGHLGNMTGFFSENLSAAREIRAFGLEEHETKRFSKHTGELVNSQIKIAKYALALSPAIEVLSAFGIGLTLTFAYDRKLEFTTFSAILMALYMCYEPIKKLGSMNSDLKRASASLDRLETVLNAPVTIQDPASPVPVDRLRGEVAFEKMTFAYNDGENVLNDVSIRIPAGTVCALVGPSGAGKSTFANLVPRFYEAVSGRVAIDGIDVRDMRLRDLRRNIALVSQEPVLFNDTIANNIRLGCPEATDAQIVQAARDAFAHDFILLQPQGYDTVVGERGSALSGGQKQRIALARAFLRNAPILILDEATSALDTESEAYIQMALKKLVVGKTVLIIAHRFSTIRDASLILVFDQGRIVAQGTHAELYASNGLYKKLYDGQNRSA